MKTIITNVQQFENSTKCSRGTSKNIIDAFILCYDITNDDLIADIYASCGVDGLEQNECSIEEYRTDEEEKRYIIVDSKGMDFFGEHYSFSEAIQELNNLN